MGKLLGLFVVTFVFANCNFPLAWGKKIVPALPSKLVPTASNVSLTYLGSMPSPAEIMSPTATKVDASEAHLRPGGESYYYLSEDATDWTTADLDCKAVLGPSGHLVYIETEHELRTVTEMLKNSDNAVSTYWVGGRYDARKEVYVWDNGTPFGSWIARDKVMPDNKRPFTRISVNITPSGLILRAQFHNVSDRYICELND